MNKSKIYKLAAGICGILFLWQATASAHVKWFSNFSFSDQPLTISQVLKPTFLSLIVLSMIAIGLLVYFDRKLKKVEWFNRTNSWLASQSAYSTTIIRVAAGAVLLLSWQADAMMVPELSITATWIGWFQFILALLLLFRKSTPIAGIGLIILYIIGISQFGMFHMLDYPMYAGAGYYLAVCNSDNKKIRGSGLPALYITVGFSLCWVALEKFIYPDWGLYVLQQHPQLALGFNLDFFLTGAAFVEFTLGYLLIICLLQRPFALIITLVFFSTTLVFGKLEIIGHTLIHGALIVFLFEGPGSIYKAPITFHKRIGLRAAFASINFLLILAILLSAYSYSAWEQFHTYQKQSADHHGQVMVPDSTKNVPTVNLTVQKDSLSGWNLHLQTQYFTFTPEKFGMNHVLGEGHAHLYLDGKKIARIYSPWYHIGELLSGEHALKVTLNANDHNEYVVDGNVISDEVEISAE